MLLVDMANVVGTRPNGWWRDRPGAARRLADQVGDAVVSGRLSGDVVLVLEGEARRGVAEGIEGGVEVVHAAGSGDDALVELAAQGAAPVVLVSADRELADRVRAVGGTVVGPTWLLERLRP